MDSLFQEIKFDQNGLVPAVAQDVNTGEVLMLAYMNREALEKSLETGLVHYWSRSRGKLWLKGETSGHYQHIKDIRLDCDGDTLLIKVIQDGAACHTGNPSCFFRKLGNDGQVENAGADAGNSAAILRELYDIIVDRRDHPKEGSYTNYLFDKGLDKILKKVGEETAEVIIAAKNKNKDEIRYEVADLVYHLFVLLVERGLVPEEIYGELRGRHKKG